MDELWNNVLDNDCTFDFIGTNYDDALYPDYSGQSFDIDYEGHDGYTLGDILAEITNYINSTGATNIFIVSGVGGDNALHRESISLILSNVNTIVDYRQEANLNVTIFIDQLLPARSTAVTPKL